MRQADYIKWLYQHYTPHYVLASANAIWSQAYKVLKGEMETFKKDYEEIEKQKEEQDAKDLKAAQDFAKEEAEKNRIRLLPDKERLIETFTILNLPEIEKFKEKEAQQILDAFKKDFLKLKKKYVDMTEKTL